MTRRVVEREGVRLTGYVIRVGGLMALAGVALVGCSSSSKGSIAAPVSTAPAPSLSSAAPSTPAVPSSAVPAPSSVAPTTTSAAPTTTSAAPTTTASPTPTAPTAAKYHKYDKDPAVANYLKWAVVDAQASKLYRGDYPPLVALETNNRISFDIPFLKAYKAKGYVLKGVSDVVVLGESGQGTSRTLRACQSTTSAGWVDTAGKSVKPSSQPWAPLLVVMKQDGQQWKVDGVYEGQFSCKGVT